MAFTRHAIYKADCSSKPDYISNVCQKQNHFRLMEGNEWLWDGGLGGRSEGLMDHGEIKVGGDWLMLSVMLPTVLGQHAAPCLYPFNLSSLPFLESVCSPSTPFLFSFFFKTSTLCLLPNMLRVFTVLNIQNIYSLWLSFLFLLSHLSSYDYSSPASFCIPSVRFFFAFSLSLSVSLPSAAPGWCECLAFEETGISLRVRNVTA